MMAAHNFKICYSGNKTWNQVLYNLSLKQAWPNFTFKWLSVHLLLSDWPYLALGSLALSWRTMSAPDKHLVFENIPSSPTWGRLGNIQFCPWSLSGTSLLRMTTIMQFRCKGKLLCSAAINSPKGLSKVVTKIVYLIARQAVCPSPPQTDETVTTDLSRTISLVHDQVRRSRITIQLWKQVSLHDTSPPTLKRYPSMCQEQTSFCAANIKHYLCISAKVSESD